VVINYFLKKLGLGGKDRPPGTMSGADTQAHTTH
jgi:hypothetical protein